MPILHQISPTAKTGIRSIFRWTGKTPVILEDAVEQVGKQRKRMVTVSTRMGYRGDWRHNFSCQKKGGSGRSACGAQTHKATQGRIWYGLTLRLVEGYG